MHSGRYSVVHRAKSAQQVVESNASKRFQLDRHAWHETADEKKRGQGRVFICVIYRLGRPQRAKNAPWLLSLRSGCSSRCLNHISPCVQLYGTNPGITRMTAWTPYPTRPA